MSFDESEVWPDADASESTVETDRTEAARPCCTLMSKASKDVVADVSDTELVAVASDTCLRFTREEINEGSAGLFDGPRGDDLVTEAFVAKSSAS